MAARPLSKASFWPLAMLALVLAFQATLIVGRAVNWDEFYHYSLVQKLASGTLTEPMQTFYTRALTWVISLPGGGIDHIVAVRWAMLGCELVTLAAIIGIARRFASREAAWLCTLAYASAGYVFQHATSFRLDGPAAALLMVSAWILLRSRLSPLALVSTGILIAVAGMLTIKAVLYAPVFAGIAWLRWSESGRSGGTALRLAGTALAAGLAFAVLYWLHARSLVVPAETTKALAGKVGARMFSFGVQPYWPLHLRGALLAPVVLVLLLAFPFVLRRSTQSRAEKLALVGLVLPVTTLLFYHNTAPYYFVFMLAPVAAGLSVVMDGLAKRYSVGGIAVVLATCALIVWAMEKPGPLSRQRQLIAAAETLFPDRPAYFDNYAFLGNFPKANTFMSPVGVSLYLQGAYPSLSATNARSPVPLVVAVDPLFEKALATREPVPDLLPQDLALLRGQYLPYWGPYWIAGHEIDGTRDITVAIPGAYRIAAGSAKIDGRAAAIGSVVDLARGTHRVEVTGAGPVRLVWAAARPAPTYAPPPQPWFTGF